MIVDRDEVAAMFKKRFKRGPWPSSDDCDRLANLITSVANTKPQPVKYADKTFALRLATFNAVRKLAHQQLARAQEASGCLRLPALVQLEYFCELLDEVRGDLLAPYDSLAGEREGSEWHKPARHLAKSVENTMRLAGYETISKEKHGRFIAAVCGALELAGQEQREPSAVAAVLAKSPL